MKNNRLVFTSISLLAAGLLLLSSCASEEGVSFEPQFAEVLDCPQSPIPESQLSLVNFSDYPDDEIINCFNFAVNKIAEVQTDVIMIIYPVGPLLLPPGEVKDNDTHYRGSGFEPVVTADQRDSMASSLERYLEPACGKEVAIFEARRDIWRAKYHALPNWAEGSRRLMVVLVRMSVRRSDGWF